MLDLNTQRARGRPRDPQKDLLILEAATALFMERGFEASSMEAIAERAGVSKMTLYSRFKDKDSLFAASVQAKCESFVGDSVFTALPGESMAQGLARIARSFVALVTDPGAVSVLGLINRESARAPQLASLFFEVAVLRMLTRMQEFLTVHIRAGHLTMPAESLAGVSWRFLGAVKGEAHLRAMLTLEPPSSESLEAHVQSCVQDFLQLYAAPRI